MSEDRNCLSYYHPILEAAGVPVPKTEFVRMSDEQRRDVGGAVFDCKPFGEEGELFVETLRAACARVGSPAFLRTGHTSAKHYWNRTCSVSDPARIKENVRQIVEFSECCGFIGLPWDVWAVREFLPGDVEFVAFDGRMPVRREFRLFVRDGAIECLHPYWPADSIKDHEPSVPDWRELLAKMNEVGDDRGEVESLALRVAAVLPGYWSVDVLATPRGWYVTDCAMGDNSYHWEGCERRCSSRRSVVDPVVAA